MEILHEHHELKPLQRIPHPHSNTRMKSNKTQSSLDLSRDCRSSHSSRSANIGKTSVPRPSSNESSPCIESIKTKTKQLQKSEPPLQPKSNHLQNFPPIKNVPENFKKREVQDLIGNKKNVKLKMNIKKMSGDIRTWLTSARTKKKVPECVKFYSIFCSKNNIES